MSFSHQNITLLVYAFNAEHTSSSASRYTISRNDLRINAFFPRRKIHLAIHISERKLGKFNVTLTNPLEPLFYYKSCIAARIHQDTCGSSIRLEISNCSETDIFSRGDIQSSVRAAFVRDPTTVAFRIYAHAAARNPILKHCRKKKGDEPIRSRRVSAGRRGEENAGTEGTQRRN